MSDLEGRTKPLLMPLITDHRCTVNAHDAATIATWATKTAMVFDCTRHSKGHFYTAANCGFVKKHLLPCSGTTVWMGRSDQFAFDNSPLHAVSFDLAGNATARHRTDPQIARVESYITTLVIGHLVLQVFSIRSSMALEFDNSYLHPKRVDGEAGVRRLWPWPASITAIDWPLDRSFPDGASLDNFAARFMPAQSESTNVEST